VDKNIMSTTVLPLHAKEVTESVLHSALTEAMTTMMTSSTWIAFVGGGGGWFAFLL
jgi:hypothetical protein